MLKWLVKIVISISIGSDSNSLIYSIDAQVKLWAVELQIYISTKRDESYKIPSSCLIYSLVSPYDAIRTLSNYCNYFELYFIVTPSIVAL